VAEQRGVANCTSRRQRWCGAASMALAEHAVRYLSVPYLTGLAVLLSGVVVPLALMVIRSRKSMFRQSHNT
jgi:hypothetical protein